MRDMQSIQKLSLILVKIHVSFMFHCFLRNALESPLTANSFCSLIPKVSKAKMVKTTPFHASHRIYSVSGKNGDKNPK